MDISLNSILASSLYANTSTTSLLGGAGSSRANAPDFTGVLTARYIDQPATKIDLSDGLAKFIEENVTDVKQKESLLADLKAISQFTTDINAAKSTNSATASLLGVRNDDGSAGILNLFV